MVRRRLTGNMENKHRTREHGYVEVNPSIADHPSTVCSIEAMICNEGDKYSYRYILSNGETLDSETINYRLQHNMIKIENIHLFRHLLVNIKKACIDSENIWLYPTYHINRIIKKYVTADTLTEVYISSRQCEDTSSAVLKARVLGQRYDVLSRKRDESPKVVALTSLNDEQTSIRIEILSEVPVVAVSSYTSYTAVLRIEKVALLQHVDITVNLSGADCSCIVSPLELFAATTQVKKKLTLIVNDTFKCADTINLVTHCKLEDVDVVFIDNNKN